MVGTHKGYLAQVSFGKESTWATAVTANQVFGRVTRFTPSPANEFIKGRGLGEGRDIQDATLSKFNLTVAVDFEVTNGKFFEFVFGSSSGTGTSGDPYLYTAANTLPSMTVEAAHGNGAASPTYIVDTYQGCVVQTCDLTATQGAKLTASMTLLGQKPDSSGSSKETLSFPTVSPYVFQQGVIKLDTSPVARVESVTMTVSNGVDPDFQISDRFIQEPQPGIRDYTYSMTAKLLDKTFKDLFYGAANAPSDGKTNPEPTSFELDMEFTQSANRYLKVNFNECFMEPYGQPIDSPEGYIVLTLSGFAKTAGASCVVST